MSLISVVIPVYNAADTLPATIAALRAQTWPWWEAILVEDGGKLVMFDVRFDNKAMAEAASSSTSSCGSSGFTAALARAVPDHCTFCLKYKFHKAGMNDQCLRNCPTSCRGRPRTRSASDTLQASLGRRPPVVPPDGLLLCLS